MAPKDKKAAAGKSRTKQRPAKKAAAGKSRTEQRSAHNKRSKVETKRRGTEGRSPKHLKKRIKKREVYSIYLYKVLKQIHHDLSISSKTMQIMNSFINDTFQRLTQEATALIRYTKKATLTEREIEAAAKLVLPRRASQIMQFLKE